MKTERLKLLMTIEVIAGPPSPAKGVTATLIGCEIAAAMDVEGALAEGGAAEQRGHGEAAEKGGGGAAGGERRACFEFPGVLARACWRQAREELVHDPRDRSRPPNPSTARNRAGTGPEFSADCSAAPRAARYRRGERRGGVGRSDWSASAGRRASRRAVGDADLRDIFRAVRQAEITPALLVLLLQQAVERIGQRRRHVRAGRVRRAERGHPAQLAARGKLALRRFMAQKLGDFREIGRRPLVALLAGFRLGRRLVLAFGAGAWRLRRASAALGAGFSLGGLGGFGGWSRPSFPAVSAWSAA